VVGVPVAGTAVGDGGRVATVVAVACAAAAVVVAAAAVWVGLGVALAAAAMGGLAGGERCRKASASPPAKNRTKMMAAVRPRSRTSRRRAGSECPQ